MYIFDFSEDGLLILKKLIGEYSAKHPQFFSLLFFAPPGCSLECLRFLKMLLPRAKVVRFVTSSIME